MPYIFRTPPPHLPFFVFTVLVYILTVLGSIIAINIHFARMKSKSSGSQSQMQDSLNRVGEHYFVSKIARPKEEEKKSVLYSISP